MRAHDSCHLSIILIVALLPAAAWAQLDVVSVNSAGTAAGNSQARNLDEDEVPGAISPDGRYVAFWSSSSDLVPNDSNGFVSDVFVRDRLLGTTILASVNAAGTGSGNGESNEPGMMSGDGRCVVFQSVADDLHPLDADTDSDVFVRDFMAGTTTLVSVNLAGTDSGNGPSYSGWIDETCSLVAFRSSATDLSADTDSDTQADIYMRDLVSGTTMLVSKNAMGTDSANAPAESLFMGQDGALLLYQSVADNLVTGLIDTNSATDIFLFDVRASTTEAITVTPGGTATGDAGSFAGVLSADAACVAFRSTATDLTTLPTNGESQIYLRDLGGGSTEMISVSVGGAAGGDLSSISVRIGEGCRFVTFDSLATDLIAADTFGERQVYRRDTEADVTELVSVNTGGVDGGNDTSDGPVMSPDGRWIAFESNATDLVAVDTDSGEDLFLRQMAGGQTILVTANADGTASGTGNSEDVAFSPNGKFLVFESFAEDLTTLPDSNGGKDVFFRAVEIFVDGFEAGSLEAWGASAS